MTATDPIHSDDVAPRFRPRIAETTVGPRLAIEDLRPAGNSTHCEEWFDLPVQCTRSTGKALEWLVVAEARSHIHRTLTGAADDLDDLYSALKRLKVHKQFTRRPVPFDPDEDRS